MAFNHNTMDVYPKSIPTTDEYTSRIGDFYRYRFSSRFCSSYRNAVIHNQLQKQKWEGSLYKPLPPHIQNNLSKLDLKGLTCPANRFVEAFVKKQLPIGADGEYICSTMRHKGVMLDTVITKAKKKKLKRKTMNARERRQKGIFKISKENQRYELYLPLHELWKGYIKEALAGGNLKDSSEPVNVKMLFPKLLKVDYHGSIITVFKSKCPGYVGLTGILLQETKNAFKIITKEDKLKTIPKANSVFSVDMEGYRCTLYGNQLKLRSAERSSKKFKSKPTTDL